MKLNMYCLWAAIAVLALIATSANAQTISFAGPISPTTGMVCNPNTDPTCILGEASSFGIYGVQLTRPSMPGQPWTLMIETNYPACNPITPGCTLQSTIATPGTVIPPAPYGAFGPLFSISDFLIHWNNTDYGVVLAQHVINGSTVDNYVPGGLYQAPNTSPDEINALSIMQPLGLAARNFDVFLAPGGTLLGPGNVSVVSGGNGTPAAYTITVQFFAPANFLSTGSFSITASSYPCANGLIIGTGTLALSVQSLTDSKSFGAVSIQQGNSTTMTISIGNPNASPATNLSFTDTLPAGLAVATAVGLADTCGGTFAPALAGGASTLSYSGGTIAAGGSCSLTLNVTGITMSPATSPSPPCPGGTMATGNQKINCVTVTAVVATVGVTAPAAVATLVVTAPNTPPPTNLTVGKSFGAMTIQQLMNTTMTISISNPNASPATNVSFLDNLPAGLTVAATPGVGDSCGGAFAPALVGGATALSYSGGTIGAGGSCAITLNVTGTTTTPSSSPIPPCPAGTMATGNQKINCVGVTAIVSNVTLSATAIATLTVTPPPIPLPPTIAKMFTDHSLPIFATTTLTFLVINVNATTILTGVNFTDTLPVGLIIATPNNLTGSCGGGTITAFAGTNSLTLSGATLGPLASCSFSVDVTAILAGAQVNTTSNIMAAGGFIGNTATDTLSVSPPTDSYQINYLPNVNVGGTVDITNAGSLGADLFGPRSGTNGRICANVYVFSPEEQEISCCSCLVTPNNLVHITAADLVSNTANGTTTDSVVVKLLFTVPGATATTPGTQAGPFNQSTCDAAYPFGLGNLAPGGRAWATKFHSPANPPSTTFGLTETPFIFNPIGVGTITQNTTGELTMLTTLCQFITGNQSGAGICTSCSLGAIGANKQ